MTSPSNESRSSSNLHENLTATFRLGTCIVGKGHPCFVIGEVAQAHDGSLGMAHAFIDAISETGANAVKFQTHIADAESTPFEPWRVRFSLQDATRFDYWKRMEFSESQWAGLKEHAEAKGLLFLSSPFSCEAIDLLSRIGVCGWKVASGEVSTPGILDRMAATGLPILMSSGMSTWAELDVVVFTLRERQAPFALLQCTTRYPCPPEEIGLNVMAEMSRRYGCPSGLSDHSGTIFGGLAARMMGASLIEVHVTLSRRMFGPDVTASVTIEELRQLVDGLQFIDRALMSQCDKDYQSAALEPTRRLFTKSVVLASDLKAGASLTRDHFAFKKPGTGIPAAEWLRLVGRRVCRDLPRNHVLQEDDLHPEGAE